MLRRPEAGFKGCRLALNGLPSNTAEVGWLLGAALGGIPSPVAGPIARRGRNVWTLEPSRNDSA